jgi:diguanylate cyclase (GGDEF)-like protein/PAS domain S-box-containing protein
MVKLHINADQAKPSLHDSELRYRRLFEAAQDGILILTAKTGVIEDVNPFLTDLLGYSREEFLQKKLWEVGAFEDTQSSKNAFLALQKNEYIRYKNLPLKSRTGELIQVEFVSNVYLEGDQKVIQCNIRDITERKRDHEALVKKKDYFREQSVRDYLTGLFNRRYMEETLKRELLRSKRKNLSLGIIMMDIDKFKNWNDNFGHGAGDVILCQLSDIFTKHIREDDIVCRYGGDEFVIVLPDTAHKVTIERAELICNAVKQSSFKYKAETLAGISISLGVASFPANGSDVETLIKAADNALLSAKRNGRGKVVEPQMSIHF